MFRNESDAEASLVDLRRAGGVAESGRWVRHRAEGVFVGARNPCAPALGRSVHHTAATEAVAVPHTVLKYNLQDGPV